MKALFDFVALVAKEAEEPFPERGYISSTLRQYRSMAKVAKEQSPLAPDGLRDKAIELYCHGSDDNIEIDADAFVSEGEDGSWVSAWVWVPKEAEE